MTLSRRHFLGRTALAIAGGSLLSPGLAALARRRKGELTGVQLYSIRTDMMKAPLETLKALRAMGYVHVEHANYVNRKFYGWPAAEFRKILDDLGLKMPSGHTVMSGRHWDESKKDFTDAWKQTVEDAAALGQQFVISPSMENTIRRDYDKLRAFMEVFNRSGELCNRYGMKFGYHNHDFEFAPVDGTTGFEILTTETDPALVALELDLYWAVKAGQDPLAIFARWPGRVRCCHVKDAGPAPERQMRDVGAGTIDFRTILARGRAAGLTHWFIEHDNPADPIASVRASAAHLTAL